MIGRWSTRIAATLAAIVCAALPAAAQTSGTTASGLFYEVSGSGEPLVFIHAFSLDRRMWEPQVAGFEDRYRVVRYDLRGHGRSVAPAEPYTGYGDLLELLDTLGIERATLIGLSAGAQLAIDFAIVHPDRVAGLVLAAPGLGGLRTPQLPWMAPVLEAAVGGDAAAAARFWAETPIMALHTAVDATPLVTSLVMDNARLWTSRRTEQPLSPLAHGRLAEIGAPTLVLIGDRDLPHIRDVVRLLAEGIADATVVTIPGAGHLINLDTPRSFNEAVAAFLVRR